MWCVCPGQHVVCVHVCTGQLSESVLFHCGPMARTQAIRPDNSVFIHLATTVERSPSMELCEGDFECL